MSVIFLLAVMVLIWLGASFGEALYVSVSGLIVISYAAMSWQLRRGR